MALWPSSYPPSTPCAPERSCFDTGGKSPPASFAFCKQDAHHAAHPRTACSRSFPLHMSRGKSLGGCQVVVRTGEYLTLEGQAHVRHVPHPTTAKHRHLTARHIPRLMLHYTPRFRLCWGQGCIVPPCLYGCCREGACLIVFAYSATLCLCPLRASQASSLIQRPYAYGLDGHLSFLLKEATPHSAEWFAEVG